MNPLQKAEKEVRIVIKHFWKNQTSYNIKISKKNEIRIQSWWTFEERATFAARALEVIKSLRNKVVLRVKRISYFLHFSLFSIGNVH